MFIILSHSQPTLKTREILTPYELEQVPTVFAPPAQHPACPDLTLSFQRSAGASPQVEPSEPPGASPSLDHRLPHNSNVPRQGFSGYAWEAQTFQKLQLGTFGHLWTHLVILGTVGQFLHFLVMLDSFVQSQAVLDSVWLFCVLQVVAFGLLLRVRPIRRTCRCCGKVGATEV